MEAWFLSSGHSLLAKETDARTTAYVEERMKTGLYVDQGKCRWSSSEEATTLWKHSFQIYSGRVPFGVTIPALLCIIVEFPIML